MVRVLALSLCLLPACGGADGPDDPLGPVDISTMALTFVPRGGGEAATFRWDDPAGVDEPTVEDIRIDGDVNYDLSVGFLHDGRDVTPEIVNEAEEYQLFFTGVSVESDATGDNPFAVVGVAYDDIDRRALPIGLNARVTTLSTGNGTFTVTVRHMPRENDVFVKDEGMAELVASRGFDALPGETAISVDFLMRVE